MRITHTNRKGQKYYLGKGVTKTGKPRYFFAKEEKGEPVSEIPEGYEIAESVNGVVSLAKVRPKLINAFEVAAVEGALKKNPKGTYYRVQVKDNMIVVCEQEGGTDRGDALEGLFAKWGVSMGPGMKFLAELEKLANYAPVMRFILKDEEKRMFEGERMTYRGGMDRWRPVLRYGKIGELAEELIPKVGTDDFFDL